MRRSALLVAALVAVASPGRAQEDAASRCERLVARMAESARESLAALGERPGDDFVARYVAATRGRDAVCAALPDERLACLEASEDPLVALGESGVNEGRPFAERILPPMMARDVVRWQAHATDDASEATTRAALRALAGTWTKTAGGSVKRLTVSAEGEVSYEETRGGETRTRAGRVEVASPTRVRFVFPGTTFDYAFYVFGDRALFSNQTATGAYPVARRGPTHLATNGTYFVVHDLRRSPRCEGFGPRLERLPVRCGWEGEGEARRFVVTRLASRSIELGTTMPEYPYRFVEHGGHLVADAPSMLWQREP